MSDLNLRLKIDALVKGVNEIQRLANEIKAVGGAAAKPIPDPTPAVRQGLSRTSDLTKDLLQQLSGLASLGAISVFTRSSIQEFARAEAAFRGLESVANYSGVGIGRAMKEAQSLAADGLMSLADASKSLQNLLQRGYSLDESVQILTRLKDAAAFNRSAHLSMSEAVVTATEGLKNENSILVDNAGVTKNVSKMWAEYAAQIGSTANDLTLAQKRQAELNGILAETEAQAGNARRALGGLQGQMAQSQQEATKFKASFGEAMVPAVMGLAKAGVFLIDNFFKPVLFYVQAYAVRVAQFAASTGRLVDLAKSRDFSAFAAGLATDRALANEQITEIAGRLNTGGLQFAPAPAGKVKSPGADGAGKPGKESEYDRLIQSIREKIAVTELEAQTEDRLTEGQRLAAKVMADLRDGTLKLTAAQKGLLAQSLETLIGSERRNAARKDDLEFEEADRAAQRHAQEEENQAIAQRHQAALSAARQLQEQSARINVDLIQDDQARAYAQLDLDKEKWQRLVTLANEGTDERRMAESAYADWVISENARIARSGETERQRRLTEHRQTLDQLRFENSLTGERALAQKLATEMRKVDLAVQERSIGLSQEHREALLEEAAVYKGELRDAILESHEASRSLETGVKSALNAYLDEATNTAAQVQGILATGFQKLEDVIVGVFTRGKFEAEEFFEAVYEGMVRMYVQNQITAPLYEGLFGTGGALSGLFSGGAGGEAAALAAGTIPLAAGGIMTSAGKLPLNTYSTGGIAYRPQIALFGEGRRPEAFVPLPDGKRIPVALDLAGVAAAAPGGAQNVRVEIVNEGTPQQVVSAQPGFDVEGMVVRIVTRDIQTNGDIATSMQNQWGLNRAAGAVR